MAIKQIEEIMCPCGEVFDAELLSAISAAEQPEFKEMLISGEVNIVCCPKCGEMFYAERFILYHDSADELIAFVYPASFAAQAKECRKQMLANYKDALKSGGAPVPAYEPVLFFGIEDLANVVKAENYLKDEEAIVKHLAQTFGMEILALAPAKARMFALPKILPVQKADGVLNNTRRCFHRRKILPVQKADGVLGALKTIIEHNINLINYAKMFIRLSKDAELLNEVLTSAKPVRKSK